jgi:hypothetical protein
MGCVSDLLCLTDSASIGVDDGDDLLYPWDSSSIKMTYNADATRMSTAGVLGKHQRTTVGLDLELIEAHRLAIKGE